MTTTMEDVDQTFVTSFKITSKEVSKRRSREELLESLQSGPKILDAYQELQKLADQLDEKVKSLLNENEKDFFLAYKTNMYDVQKEFKALKQKADEEETKTRRDAKIHSLEKELHWFMQEALRLDELCKKYKRELDNWKTKAEALDDDRHFLESQIKAAKGNNVALRSAVEKAQTSAYKALVTGPKLEERVEEQSDAGEEMTLAPELENRYIQSIAQLKKRLQGEQQQIKSLRNAKSQNWAQTSDLERYFVQCIDEVKNEVRERREHQNADRLARPRKGISSEEITLEDLTASDRRRVLEKLLSNEQVLVFLYEKLFPHKKLAEQTEGSVLPIPGGTS